MPWAVVCRESEGSGIGSEVIIVCLGAYISVCLTLHVTIFMNLKYQITAMATWKCK